MLVDGILDMQNSHKPKIDISQNQMFEEQRGSEDGDLAAMAMNYADYDSEYYDEEEAVQREEEPEDVDMGGLFGDDDSYGGGPPTPPPVREVVKKNAPRRVTKNQNALFDMDADHFGDFKR